MPSVAQSIASAGDANEILAEIYGTQFPEVFNNETVLLHRLQKRKGNLRGEQFVFPIHTAGNSGVGSRAETGASSSSTYLPTPGSQGVTQGVLTRKHYYARFKVTGAALSAARGDGALVDLLTMEMTGLRRDLAKRVNIDLFGDGSSVFDVVTNKDTVSATVGNSRKFQIGNKYVFGDKTDGSDAVELQVTNIDHSTGVLTLDGSTYASGDGVMPSGVESGQSSAWGTALSGLDLIVNDAASTYSASQTYANIDRSSAGNGFWKAQSLSGANGLTQDLMLEAQQQMRYGNGELSLIICHPLQWRRYGNLMSPDRRWSGTAEKLDGGFSALDFNGVPVVADLDCPKDVMYFLDESTFQILEEEPPNFINRMGSAFVFVGSGGAAEDAFEVTLVWRLETACDNPAANCRVDGLPT